MEYHDSGKPIDQHLLDIAVLLLEEVGEGFTIEQLAQRAHLSRATVYRRVGTKASLLQRLAERGVYRDPQDPRTKILTAARSVFSRNGLVNATMEQIAQEANVGVATVYRQFGDKEQLVRTFAEQATPYSAVYDIVVHPSADVRRDLTALLDIIIPFFHRNHDLFRMVLGGSQSERDYLHSLRSGSNRIRDRLIEYFSTQIQAGRLRHTIHPQEMALMLLGMVMGHLLIGPLDGAAAVAPPDRIRDTIVDMFLDGVLIRRPEG